MKARKKKAAQRAAKRTTEMKEKIATNAENKKAEVVDSTEKTTAAKNTTKKEVELPEVKAEPEKEEKMSEIKEEPTEETEKKKVEVKPEPVKKEEKPEVKEEPIKTEKAEKGSCSGAGPTKECVVKPDVIAPGYQIISCNSQIHGKKDAYTVKSGSSMATPVVSGAVALLMEKYPRVTNVEVKLRLRETCIHLPGAGEQGWGMLNIRDFLKL